MLTVKFFSLLYSLLKQQQQKKITLSTGNVKKKFMEATCKFEQQKIYVHVKCF